MAWTTTDVLLLERSIADGRGARSITFSDQSVTFGSIDEMLRLLSVMRQSVNVATGGSNVRYAATSKGC